MTCGAAPGSPPSRASRTRKLDRSVRPQAPGSGVMRARGLLEPLRLFAVAVGFLTRVPVPQTDIRVDDLRRASAFFPLVGLGVAGVGVAVRAAFEPIWGSGVATLAAIAAMILVTGAFHEDGLADTADGLWGGWDPAARLAIMRDSRIGTYGAVALIIVIALRAGLLLPLGLADFTRAVVCGHVLARAATHGTRATRGTEDAGEEEGGGDAWAGGASMGANSAGGGSGRLSWLCEAVPAAPGRHHG